VTSIEVGRQENSLSSSSLKMKNLTVKLTQRHCWDCTQSWYIHLWV